MEVLALGLQPHPSTGREKVADGGDLNRRLGADLEAVMSEAGHHPELGGHQQKDGQQTGPDPQLQNRACMLIYLHAATLARQQSRVLIDKPGARINLSNAPEGAPSYRWQAGMSARSSRYPIFSHNVIWGGSATSWPTRASAACSSGFCRC
jgi:hypothetical protein